METFSFAGCQRVVAWKKYMEALSKDEIYGTDNNNSESAFRILKEEMEKWKERQLNLMVSFKNSLLKRMKNNVINIKTKFF